MAPTVIDELRLEHLWVLDLITDGYAVTYPRGLRGPGAAVALVYERPALCAAHWDR